MFNAMIADDLETQKAVLSPTTCEISMCNFCFSCGLEKISYPRLTPNPHPPLATDIKQPHLHKLGFDK